MQNSIIQQAERCKHLRPALSEQEIILNIAYRFSQNIKLVIYTQGIKEVEDILFIVSQSENLLKEGVSKKCNSNANKIVERKKGTEVVKPTIEQYKNNYPQPGTNKRFSTLHKKMVQTIKTPNFKEGEHDQPAKSQRS